MESTKQIADKSRRSTSKEQRRSRILAHARQVIATQGFDALKLRDLAARADLTVPTIYNLIGGKTDILSLIIEDLVSRIEAIQASIETDNIETAFEIQIEKLAELYKADEEYYRASFIAGDRCGLFEQTSSTGIFAKSVSLPIAFCQKAIDAKLLQGNVSAEKLGRQIYGCYRLARQDWSNGYFGLDQFRDQALTGVYLCLAADATPEYRQRLLGKLSADVMA